MKATNPSGSEISSRGDRRSPDGTRPISSGRPAVASTLSAQPGQPLVISRRSLLRTAAALGAATAAGGLLQACSLVPAWLGGVRGHARRPAGTPAAGLRPSGAPQPGPTAAPTAVVPASKTISIAVTGDLAGFDPFNLSPANSPILSTVYSQPLQYDPQLTLQPKAAESWQLGDGGKTLALRLRSGLKFQNGREVTGDDVVKNFTRARSRDQGSNLYPLLAGVDSVEASNSNTIIIRLYQPVPTILETMALFSLVAPEAFGDLNKRGVGTGPFQLVDWVSSDHVTLDRFTGYWAQPKPMLDRAVFKIFGDDDAMMAALLAGTVDAAAPVPPRYFDRVNGVLQLQRDSVPTSSLALLVNRRRQPFDKKEVRQALQWSIDRPSLANRVLNGLGEWAVGLFPRGTLAYDPTFDSTYRLDAQKAKGLLKAGGQADGFQASLILPGNMVELADLGGPCRTT